jgi:hypothetical protein
LLPASTPSADATNFQRLKSRTLAETSRILLGFHVAFELLSVFSKWAIGEFELFFVVSCRGIHLVLLWFHFA